MHEVDDFFDRYIRNNLYPAVECTLKTPTLYACAMLLFSYTEIVGGHLTGNLGEREHGKRNFDAFLKYMGKDYAKISQEVDLYSCLRSGLVHESEPNVQYALWKVDSVDKKKVAIVYTDEPSEMVSVDVRAYFLHFKEAIERLYIELNSSQKNPDLYSNFISCRRKMYEKYLIKEDSKSP
ncbi:MAG: hypothetical protein O6761_08255 [Thaumarchaeota archaeon]|nr:hypothetical protein [Nitrososphaerota archaeon]